MWLKEITIYHKTDNSWVKYHKEASVRDTSILNRNNLGKSDSDTGVIRVFDIKDYKVNWFVGKGDVIVIGNVDDDITSAPITNLRQKYGYENVFSVRSIDKFIFSDNSLESIEHIKLGVY